MKLNRLNNASNWIILITLIFFAHNISIAQLSDVHIEYERLSEKVLLVWGGKVYKDQVAAIATEMGIVLIDVGKAPTLTKEYRKIIERELGRNDFKYVINTHYHYDHSSGNQVFPEADVIAHDKTPAMMKQWADNRQNFVNARRNNQMIRWENQLAAVEPETEQWYRLKDYLTTGNVMLDDYENNYTLTLPDITFNDKMNLDMGDVTLELFYFGEGMHTGDDILILYPEEKMLFSGDLFYGEWFRFANVPNFDCEKWSRVLSEIFDKNEISWVYDCHNGKMSGDFISLYKDYMKDVWKSLLKAKDNGLNLAAVQEEYSYARKFSYISASGLDVDLLKGNHANNLKFTWYCVNEAVSAAGIIREVINSSGIKAAIAEYEEIKNAPAEKYFFDERELNMLGYGLMGGGKIDEAVAVFKMMIEKYPQSSNAFDSYGEALMNAGVTNAAIEAYEKSLELDSGNANAVEQLKKLRGDE